MFEISASSTLKKDFLSPGEEEYKLGYWQSILHQKRRVESPNTLLLCDERENNFVFVWDSIRVAHVLHNDGANGAEMMSMKIHPPTNYTQANQRKSVQMKCAIFR